MKKETKKHSSFEDKDPDYNTQQSNPEVASTNQGFPFSCCNLSQSNQRGFYIGENYMDQGKVHAEESLGKSQLFEHPEVDGSSKPWNNDDYRQLLSKTRHP